MFLFHVKKANFLNAMAGRLSSRDKQFNVIVSLKLE